MKKTNWLAMLLAGALVCGFGVGCGENGGTQEGGTQQGGTQGEHTHTFSEKWTSDENSHWHAATCAHKEEISDKAAHTFTNSECTVCHYYKIGKDTDVSAIVSDKLTEEEWKEALSEETLDNFKAYVATYDEGTALYTDVQSYSFVGKSWRLEQVLPGESIDKLRATKIVEYKEGKYEFYQTIDEQLTQWVHGSCTKEMYESTMLWYLPGVIAEELRSLKDKFAQATYDDTLNAYLFSETDPMHGMYAERVIALKFKNGRLCGFTDFPATAGQAESALQWWCVVYGYGEAEIAPPTDYVEAGDMS